MQTLSLPQKQAVEYISSPAIIIAGAGSGKTFTVVSKLEYLIAKIGFSPERILAITFTNNAADDMKFKLQAIIGKSIAAFPWVKTIHSACLQILELHSKHIGYKQPLSIIQGSQQKAVIQQAIDDFDLSKSFEPKFVINTISKAKNSGNPQKFLSSLNNPLLANIYNHYNRILASRNAIDYEDMLLITRNLLRDNPKICNSYRQLFQYIIVDEFQDTNNVQLDIFNLLINNGNITVVGDDYQSIYEFRGANPYQFNLFYQQHPDSAIFRLEENFRSTQTIVLGAQSLIDNNGNAQIKKQCYSRRAGNPIYVKEFHNDEAEANWIAQACLHIHNNFQIPYNNMAVLFRVNRCAQKLKQAFAISKIKYLGVGLETEYNNNFFNRREIKDILSYLNSGIKIKDNISFLRIINIPKKRVGKNIVEAIRSKSNKNLSCRETAADLLKDNLLTVRPSKKLNELLLFLESIPNISPAVAIQHILNSLEYDDYLRSYSKDIKDYGIRRQAIDQLIQMAGNEQSVSDFLGSLEFNLDKQPQKDIEENRVKLSTIHAAKGLEFQAVIMCGMEEGYLPDIHAITGFNLQSPEIMEERRIAYVGMTRASDYLCLTYSRFRNNQPTQRSRFINEINQNLLAYI